MFKAAYTTEFYRAVREALHAEVDSWSQPEAHRELNANVVALWRIVDEMEPLNRVPDAFELPKSIDIIASSSLVAIEQLSSLRKV
jgi:hypothetical protein